MKRLSIAVPLGTGASLIILLLAVNAAGDVDRRIPKPSLFTWLVTLVGGTGAVTGVCVFRERQEQAEREYQNRYINRSGDINHQQAVFAQAPAQQTLVLSPDSANQMATQIAQSLSEALRSQSQLPLAATNQPQLQPQVLPQINHENHPATANQPSSVKSIQPKTSANRRGELRFFPDVRDTGVRSEPVPPPSTATTTGWDALFADEPTESTPVTPAHPPTVDDIESGELHESGSRSSGGHDYNDFGDCWDSAGG